MSFDRSTFEPKAFRPQRPDGKWSLEGVERVPHRLPELIQGVKDSKPILLLEGENDVDKAMLMGLVATTFVGGTGKCKQEYLEHFRGATGDVARAGLRWKARCSCLVAISGIPRIG